MKRSPLRQDFRRQRKWLRRQRIVALPRPGKKAGAKTGDIAPEADNSHRITIVTRAAGDETARKHRAVNPADSAWHTFADIGALASADIHF
ncbi:hypothetical protein ABIF86_001300 [Bradyrhizobium japonicum]